MKRKIIPILLCLFVIFSLSKNAFPVLVWNFQRITDNADDDRHPSLYNAQIAWKSVDDIVFWDGETTTVVGRGRDPSLYDGKIAWADGADVRYWDGEKVTVISRGDMAFLWNGTIAFTKTAVDEAYEVFYWNGTVINRITYNDYFEFLGSLHNDQIAWTREGLSVHFWDGTEIFEISPRYPLPFISLYDGKIVYSANDEDGDDEIYCWTGGTQDIIQITSNDANDGQPDIYEGKIVWVGPGGGDTEIYFWDGNAIHQVTDNDYDDWSPDLYVSGKRVEIGYRSQIGGDDWEIMYAWTIIPEPSSFLIVFLSAVALLILRRK